MAYDMSNPMSFYAPQGDDILGQMHLAATNPDLFAELMTRQGIAPPPPGSLPQMASADDSMAPHNLLRRMFGAPPTGMPSEAPPTTMGMGEGYPQEPRGAFPSQPMPGPGTQDGAPAKEVMGTQPAKLSQNAVPVPRPRPATAPATNTGAPGTPTKDLLSLLSGVKAPSDPRVQTIRTPEPTAAKGVPQDVAVENLIKQMLGLATGGANMLRLGQALAGR
jgi:hypothetical protein